MSASGYLTDFLDLLKVFHRRLVEVHVKLISAFQRLRLQFNIFQALYPADTAAGAPYHGPSVFFELEEASRRNFHFDNQTVAAAFFDLDVVNMRNIRNDSFR